MDVDDVMHRERLAAQVSALEEDATLSAIGCHVRLFPRAGMSPRLREYEGWLNGLASADAVAADAFVECPVAHPTLVMHRAMAAGCGSPPEHEVVAADLGRQRLGAWFFSGFGLTALLLGAGGVFGLVAYWPNRAGAISRRLALGATHANLVRRGLACALWPVAFGAAAGLALAAWVSRFFTSLLTGLSALDPLTCVVVALTC